MTTIARIRRSLRGCRLRFSFGLDMFEEGYCLDLFGFLISLPFLDRYVMDLDKSHDIMYRWGTYYHERMLVLCWKGWTKHISMPWALDHVITQVRRPDGTWTKKLYSWETDESDGREVFVTDYKYVLRSGEVQHREATVYVERREWRQRWLMWCPWFAFKRTSIDVHFNDEVGERTGSWKGGCIGCGYDLKPGEHPIKCLRRMEQERVFN